MPSLPILRLPGATHAELIANLRSAGIIKHPSVIQTMNAVDRADFSRLDPYEDMPQSIGYGATISAPHMHGYALEYLAPALKPGAKVLDVGSGSGYLTVCMAMMVGETGKVVGIDHMDGLVKLSIENTKKHHADLLASGRVKFVTGDGRLGYPEQAPYDCIHVGAASNKEPVKLLEQLAPNGSMFIPVGSSISALFGGQQIKLYKKDDKGNVESKGLMEVAYVPLTDPDSQY